MGIITNIKQSLLPVKAIQKETQKIYYKLRRDQMLHYALECRSMGTNSETIHDGEIIVSVASYMNRIKQVAYGIESIMQGTVKPNRIILNIPESQKAEPLPVLLQRQQKRGLEINYCKDLGSYNKIIHTLRRYPDSYIITIDDDCIYCEDLIERLVNESKMHPRDICAMRVHRITFNSAGKAKTYRSWKRRYSGTEASYKNLQTGIGGVIYPPHSLSSDVLDESTFLSICPKADDIWLYAMAVKQGTQIRKVHSYDSDSEEYIINPDINDGLECFNVKKHGNDSQFKAVFEKYQLYDRT